jgi:hypothetical protein
VATFDVRNVNREQVVGAITGAEFTAGHVPEDE